MITTLFVFGDWALFALRVVLGAIMITHGWQKAKGIKGTAGWLGSLGFKPAIMWAYIATYVELLGGLCLVFGFLTQYASILIALQFIVILLKIKKFQKFMGEGGYELDLLILVGMLVLLTVGSGALSLDTTLFF